MADTILSNKQLQTKLKLDIDKRKKSYQEKAANMVRDRNQTAQSLGLASGSLLLPAFAKELNRQSKC